MADKTISQLPQLPGNLTLDTILAVVQNGVAHKAEVGEVVDLTLGNIKAVNNSDGAAVRIPGVNLQICFHSLQAEHVGSSNYLRMPATGNWNYPLPFANPPTLFLQSDSNDADAPGVQTADRQPPIPWSGASASSMGNARLYAASGSFAAGDYVTIHALAIGFFNP